MTNSYEFRGIPLTGNVFAALALELVEPDKAVHRDWLMQRVLTSHVDRGGLRPRGDLTSVAKKGLSDLQKRGLVTSAGAPGWWRFGEAVADEKGDPEKSAVFVLRCSPDQADAVLAAVRSVLDVKAS